MFLERAFGITSDGTVTIELKKEFRSVKTYKKYTDTIHVMSNWGDNAVLKEASSDNPVAAADIIMSGTSRLRRWKLFMRPQG